jgi:hypothetical protein
MNCARYSLALCVILLVANAGATSAFLPLASERIVAPGLPSFGMAVELDGDTAAVSGNGAVRVYDTKGEIWVLQSEVVTSSTSEAVSLSGSWLATGTPGADGKGSVRLHMKGTELWAFQQSLQPSVLQTGDAFGASTAMTGDQLVVGATGDSTSSPRSGAAYAFARDANGIWQETQKLAPTEVSSHARFGEAMAMRDGLLVIGAPDDSTSASLAGAAFVYEWTDGEWVEVARLVAPDTVPNGRFGKSVATDGNVVVVGAPFMDGLETRMGMAFVFTRNGASWRYVSNLVEPVHSQNAQFGRSVALAEGVLVVGAPGVDAGETNTGAAYVYDMTTGLPVLQARLLPETAVAFGTLGAAVATDGRTIVAGSPASGTVYVYEGMVGKALRTLKAPPTP